MEKIVTSAVELNNSQRQKIEEQISRIFGNEGMVTYQKDEGIGSGIIIKQGDTVIDLSLNSRLREIKEQMNQ